MKKEKKNFIWNTIGLTFNAFISLFLLIIVKRINGLNIAGIFTYSFSLCCLFFIISIFYSRTFQVSEYKREFNFNDYLVFRIIFDILSLALIFIFSIISGFDKYKILVIILLMIYKCIEALCDSIFGQIQIEGNLYKTGISYTLKFALGIFVFFLVDYFTKNLLLSIVGLNIVSLLILFFYDIPALKIKASKLNINKDKLKRLFIITFPVFIYTFLENYLSNSQKMIMTYFIDNKLQTIFGILIMPATMILLVGNYIIMPFINDLTNKFKNKKYNEFDNLVTKICLVVFIIGLLCIIVAYFLGIPVLNFIYSINLEEYKLLLIIIMIGAVLNSIIMVLTNVLTIINVNKIQTFIYLIMSILATLITIMLASIYKINGLCYSYLITFIVLFIIYFITYKTNIRKLGEKK